MLLFRFFFRVGNLLLYCANNLTIKMTVETGKRIYTEDVVISGISGVFPQSDNMQEFAENLLAGKDMVEEVDRWKKGKSSIFQLNFNIQASKHNLLFFRISRHSVESRNSKISRSL